MAAAPWVQDILGPDYELPSGSIVQSTLFVKDEPPGAFFPAATEI